jgi:hypothetical protein
MIQDILPQGDDPAGAMLESIKGNTIHYGELRQTACGQSTFKP